MMLKMEEVVSDCHLNDSDFVSFMKVCIAGREHHVVTGTDDSQLHGNCIQLNLYLLFCLSS